MATFAELGLSQPLVDTITKMGFETPTPIQEKSIPQLLENPTDLVGLAQTGTGKTAAFGLPLMDLVDTSNSNTQAVVIAPTRELCLQISKELERFAAGNRKMKVYAVYGGTDIGRQIRDVKRGVHIVVATPGRLRDMINRKAVNISNVDYVVLDEADEMLNMGFKEEIDDILENTPEEKSTWLFSATMPKEVRRIAKNYMTDPIELTVGEKNTTNEDIDHQYVITRPSERYEVLRRFLDFDGSIFGLVFTRTRRDSQEVAERLSHDGYNAGALHGDLSQAQRDKVMQGFRKGRLQILVATDVAARGIDVDNITHVINYQLPDEIETYTHRSGRTGRAGNTGVSMVIVSKSELRKIKSIERIIKKQFEKKDIPSGTEITEVQLMSLANKIHNTETGDEIDKYLESINELFVDTSKEDLIKKFFSVEFNRFHNYYQKSKDLGVVDSRGGEGRDYGKSSNDTRYFINVGRKDGFDWMKLKDFLKEQLELGRDDVFKVDVKESFSFFNTEKETQEKVLAFFTNFKHEGRFVNVEVSENRGGGGRKRSGGGRRRDGGSGGGRRRSDDRRSERRSSDRGDRKPRRSDDSGNRGDRRSRRSNDDKPRGRRSENSNSSYSGSDRPRRSRRRD